MAGEQQPLREREYEEQADAARRREHDVLGHELDQAPAQAGDGDRDEEEALDELRDQGDLDMSGLNSSEPGVLKELVRNLFLFCYARALRPEGTDWI